MSGTPLNRFYSSLYRGGSPATMLLIAINVITFFSTAILQGRDPSLYLVFRSFALPQQFWTLVTWPLCGAGHPFTVLFACLWANWVCGSLERSWGTRTFTTFFFATAALMALTCWIGGNLLQHGVGFAGLSYAVAAPTVAWCAINRRDTIMLYGILPLSAVIIGWLTVVVIWYELGPQVGSPVMGLFALSGCAAAYWYAMQGRYLQRGYTNARNPGKPNLRLHVVDDSRVGRDAPVGGFPPARWLRAQQERRKLEKLWKRSGFADPDEKDSRQDRR